MYSNICIQSVVKNLFTTSQYKICFKISYLDNFEWIYCNINSWILLNTTEYYWILLNTEYYWIFQITEYSNERIIISNCRIGFEAGWSESRSHQNPVRDLVAFLVLGSSSEFVKWVRSPIPPNRTPRAEVFCSDLQSSQLQISGWLPENFSTDNVWLAGQVSHFGSNLCDELGELWEGVQGCMAL